MANVNTTQIPANRAAVVDDTNVMAREWYLFLQNVQTKLPTSFEYNSSTQVAAGAIGSLTVTGVDCLGKKVTVSAWGGGENTAADAYLVGYSVTNRTSTGCVVNVKNLGAAAQTLSACVVVTS
jgi:hypothetical protein